MTHKKLRNTFDPDPALELDPDPRLPRMLDMDPVLDRTETNADPQHC
jgi:hypothetical protein